MDRFILITIVLITLVAGCGEYSRGDRFKANFGEDSLLYVVAAKGSGDKISQMASRMKFEHESRGNTCVITYLTDSTELNDKKALLLLNSTMPNVEEDFLSKGFIGQFASRQIVSYLLVGYDDVGSYLKRKD